MRFKQRKMVKILFGYIIVFYPLIMISCSNVKQQDQQEVILAKVGDKTISLSEFKRRAEMTVRPPYCRGDNNIHKKIVINSLIAEKMLAIEAGEINELNQNKQFQLYIQGRQEQAMREWLLHEEGFEKVRLDDSEIQKVFDISGMTYKIQYYTIPDDSIAENLKESTINKDGIFETLHQQLWQGDEIPEREVAWKSPEHPKIHEALFSDKIARDSVIGPVRIGDNNHILMKVKGWTDKPAISESDRQQRLNSIKEKLTSERALQIYDKYVVGIMEGKKLEFDPKTFNIMVNLIRPLYMRTSQDKRELFLDAAFNRTAESPEMNRLAEGINGILDQSFFQVEDEVWTVEDFKEELQRHPLVFRKKVEYEEEFAQQYKLAIVDMVRDRYLTREAYERGYHNADVVKRNTQMWHDALSAQYQMNTYLKNNVPNLSDSLNTLILLRDYLNPYIDQLQKKYSDQIHVNVEEFDEIKLTRTDMIVIQKNVPFHQIVPEFPKVTTDSKLDYGKRLE